MNETKSAASIAWLALGLTLLSITGVSILASYFCFAVSAYEAITGGIISVERVKNEENQKFFISVSLFMFGKEYKLF